MGNQMSENWIGFLTAMAVIMGIVLIFTFAQWFVTWIIVPGFVIVSIVVFIIVIWNELS